MRIYSRADFLKLPEGTVYCCGKPWYFGELAVKGETRENDFLCCDLQIVDSSSTEEMCDRLEKMLATGASFPLNGDYGRNGSFDGEVVFLVYETADLAEIIRIFQAAMSSR